MSWLSEPFLLRRELLALAREVAGWEEQEALHIGAALPEQYSAQVDVIARRLNAISQAHTAQGHARFSLRDEPLRSVWAGIRRVYGTAPRGKAPVMTADLKAMVAGVPDSLLGRRDRALLLLGFAGAFRRSELVGLTVADVQFTADGATVTKETRQNIEVGTM